LVSRRDFSVSELVVGLLGVGDIDTLILAEVVLLLGALVQSAAAVVLPISIVIGDSFAADVIEHSSDLAWWI
jgi:hypothetical protein